MTDEIEALAREHGLVVHVYGPGVTPGDEPVLKDALAFGSACYALALKDTVPKKTHEQIVEAQRTLLAGANRERAELEQRKDDAYTERNRMVAAFGMMAVGVGWKCGLAKTAIEGWSEDWHWCFYIDLPTGQVSWHLHDSHLPLFAHFQKYDGAWDGHDTPEKYRRITALVEAAEVTNAQPK